METKEKEFNGMVINGFVALLLLLALTALSVYGVVYFVNLEHVTGIVLSVLAALLFLILLTGLRKQEPNEAMAMMFFGNYCGTFKKTGFIMSTFCFHQNAFLSALVTSMLTLSRLMIRLVILY